VKVNTAEQLGAEPLNPYTAPADTSTPVGQNDQGGELATPSSRLAAQIIDNLLFLAAAMPGGVVGAILGSSFQFGSDKDDSAIVMAGALGLLTGLLFYIYQCQLIAGTGQSLGKRWSHVRIALEGGEPPGFWRGVVLRSWALFLLRIIPGLGYIVNLVDSLMVFSEGRRCLHDRIAGTRVLKA
jgi:uncharacterized RDD family membrane protein YckC